MGVSLINIMDNLPKELIMLGSLAMFLLVGFIANILTKINDADENER